MKTQVAIVGGGPGGTACAIFLAKKGIESVIIEKDEFPRFHIGESMTGECGNVVRQLGLTEEMASIPHTIKPGVKVFGQEGRNTFHVPVMRRTDEGVLEETFTWQVRRDRFDKLLMDKAQLEGATVIRGKAVKALQAEDGRVTGVQVRQEDGSLLDITADMVVDASGAATFLSNQGVAGPKERGKYDRQIAIYSHVKGARREEQDHTLIFFEKRNHWAWFIPLDEETVSVGVVTPSDYYKASGESMRDYYLREMHKINPELTARVPEVELVEDVHATSNYSYHIKQFAGPGYLCVGDSHRFIDPIFSFGLHFALTEAREAANVIAKCMQNPNSDETAALLATYQKHCELGMDAIQDVLDCFWENPLSFAFFAHSRYRDDFIDLFAGRVYQYDPSPGLLAVRKINAQQVEHSLN